MKRKSAILGLEIVAVSQESVLKAQRRIAACQACSETVSRPFASVLIEVLGAAGPADYILCAPARCPNCAKPIVENTLVRCEGEIEEGVPALREFETYSEDTNVVLIDEKLLSRAQAAISGCEQCAPMAELTFDYILDEVTECDPTVTEYVMCHPAKCPSCHHEVTEKTLVVAH